MWKIGVKSIILVTIQALLASFFWVALSTIYGLLPSGVRYYLATTNMADGTSGLDSSILTLAYSIVVSTTLSYYFREEISSKEYIKLPKKVEGFLFSIFPALFAILIMIRYAVALINRQAPGNLEIDVWYYFTVSIAYAFFANWVINMIRAMSKIYQIKQVVQTQRRV